MRAFVESGISFEEKTMKRATFFQAIITFLIICSVACGAVVLKVNESDPAVFPLQLNNPESLQITLADAEAAETSYNLTLSATGGAFLYEDPNATSETAPQATVNIQTSDLGDIGNI